MPKASAQSPCAFIEPGYCFQYSALAVNASAPTTGRPIVCAMETDSTQLYSAGHPMPFDQNSHIGTSATAPDVMSQHGFMSYGSLDITSPLLCAYSLMGRS